MLQKAKHARDPKINPKTVCIPVQDKVLDFEAGLPACRVPVVASTTHTIALAHHTCAYYTTSNRPILVRTYASNSETRQP